MHKNIINCCFLLFFFFGCSKTTENTSFIKLEEAQQKENLNDFVENIEVLKLVADVNIVEISKVVFFKSRYYVLDKKSSKMLVFDTQGKLLHKIGSRGQGPGEYTKLSDFTVDSKNEQLLLFSRWDSKLLKFDLEGNFLSSLRIDNYPSDFALTSSGNYIFYTVFNSPNLHSIIYTDQEGKPLKYAFPFPEGTMILGAGCTGGLHKQGVTNYFSEMTSSVIYEVNDSILPKYKFDFGKATWDEEKRYNIEDFLANTMEVSYLNNYYCDTENVLAFSFSHKKFLRRGFYFKNTGNYVAAPYNIVPQDLLYRLLYLPVGVRGTQFISALDYDLFEVLLESPNNKEKLKETCPKFYEDIKDFQPDDNPYLIFYEIKEKT